MWISPWTRLLDLVAPRRCACCGARLSPTEEVLCAPCLLRLPRTHQWLHPLDNQLARLFYGLFPVEKAAAYIFYQPHDSTAYPILQLKYRSKPWIGVALGRCMAREMASSGFFDGVDALVPVPLSFHRQRKRGYNQSERIARGISQVTGLPVATGALKRIRFGRSQTQLTHEERRENVRGLFKLVDARRVEGLHVLLVDDIVTTGSTMWAAAEPLMQVRGITVSVLSVGFAWGGA